MSMGGNGPQSHPEISEAGKREEGAPAEELGTESDGTDLSVDEEEQVHEEEEQSDGDTLSGDDSDSDSDELVDAVPVSSPVQEARARKNKFDMTFEVPYGNGACRELEVSSDTPFSSFLDKLSRTMEVRKTLLSGIAYIPSYLPKNPKPIPKLLEDKKSWKKLVEGVEVHIKTSRDKNRGKGVVTPFSIQIIDTSGPVGDSKASAGAGTKKGKKDRKADSTEEVPVEAKEKKFYRELEQKYHCAEHDKPCAVLSEGTHYHLSNNDLSKWAYLIASFCLTQHKATKEVLPRSELKIDDAMPRQHAAKKNVPNGPSAGTEPPEWVQALFPIAAMAMGGAMRNNMYETPRPSTPPPLRTAGSSRPSALVFGDLPSSGTKRAAEMAAPSIDAWLGSLDSDVHGRGRHNIFYLQYCSKFSEHGIFDLTDMVDIEANELTKLIECPIGVANRLIKYAKDDMDTLTNAAKRARRGRA
ncbi:hypothetical protein DFH08DRAFT_978495 [Mycena albidolilacea]|uniref:SAM domain-containing protein n=1 Tax=Mycena albidolilacea TaxID=1033008 RepID=A0AAD6YZ65_9AGAR|nr:hypothetical protein DFH08DRAFT_978495 [Mycena albidolilacea]